MSSEKLTPPREPPSTSGTPNWVPIVAGVLIGLGVLAIAYKLFSKSKPSGVSFVCYKKPPPPTGIRSKLRFVKMASRPRRAGIDWTMVLGGLVVGGILAIGACKYSANTCRKKVEKCNKKEPECPRCPSTDNACKCCSCDKPGLFG